MKLFFPLECPPYKLQHLVGFSHLFNIIVNLTIKFSDFLSLIIENASSLEF